MSSQGVLTGLTVIEMAGLGPGPYAAMLLADLGAEVIRIDRVDKAIAGDPAARTKLLNRGRRSIALDLKQPAAQEIVLEMVARSDAIFEGFRPGVMERLGLGPDVCQARNPRIVYGRMTGWGQAGPLAPTVGHDINYASISGALTVAGRAGERPVPPVNFLADFGGGGTFMVIGILAALWEAQRSGRGQVIDVTMIDGSATFTAMLHGYLAEGRWKDERGVNFSDTGSHFYEVYECADGKCISVGALEPQFYRDLLRGLGLDEQELPGSQWDKAAWPAMKALFADRIRTRRRDEWLEVFSDLDACVAPVLSLRESTVHPHNVARAGFVEHHGIVQPAPAPRFDRTPSALGSPPPHPGEHTRSVLEDLGWSGSDIDALAARGVTHQFIDGG
jgi:alpha-methylacyl-CoA racemase